MNALDYLEALYAACDCLHSDEPSIREIEAAAADLRALNPEHRLLPELEQKLLARRQDQARPRVLAG